MKLLKTSLLALALSLSATFLPGIAGSSAMADTLVIKNTGQFYSSSKPQKGISKAQVRKRFGEPVKSYSAIGNPPITRWKFENFTVYFEYDHVIHAVDNKRSRQP